MNGREQLGFAFLLIACFVVLAPVVVWIAGMSGALLTAVFVQVVVVAAVGLGLWAMIAWSKQRRLMHVVVRAFLSEGRCPVCAYDLSGLEPEPDGCTVCPECGAAWRISPARS